MTAREIKEGKAMKYIFIDEKDNDFYTLESDDALELIAKAKEEWQHLSSHDKKQRTTFEVRESVNPDEEAPDHFDGNPVWSALEEA